MRLSGRYHGHLKDRSQLARPYVAQTNVAISRLGKVIDVHGDGGGQQQQRDHTDHRDVLEIELDQMNHQSS